MVAQALGRSSGPRRCASSTTTPSPATGLRLADGLGARVALPGAHGHFWVPIIGPLIGGVIGAVLYDLFVGDTLRAPREPPAPDVEASGVRRDGGGAPDSEREPQGMAQHRPAG